MPLPQLVEPHLNYYTQHYYGNDSKKSGKRRSSITSLISRIVKFTTNSMVGGKSNSEKIEMYLRRCALHPTVGRSSLFRDFLAAQRNEDQIVPNRAILEQIHLEQSRILSHRASFMVAAPSAPGPIPLAANTIPIPALINNNHSNESCSSSITSSSMMITSSLDSCHTSNNISNENNNNNSSAVIPGGIPIHVPCTASASEVVIGGDISSATTYESLINDNNDKQTKLAIRDFEILKVLGRGCTGKVKKRACNLFVYLCFLGSGKKRKGRIGIRQCGVCVVYYGN